MPTRRTTALALPALALPALVLPAVALVLGTAPPAHAAPLGPGETVERSDFSLDRGAVAGTVVAERTRRTVVDLVANADDFVFDQTGTPTLGVPVAFTERVLRTDDGTLTFVYALDPETPSGFTFGDEANRVQAGGFAGVATDVEADVAAFFEGVVSLSRSADGASVSASGPPAMGADDSFLVVDTDATEFGESGRVSYAFADEYNLTGVGPEEGANGASQIASAAFAFEGTYAPGGGSAIVPLPAAGWAGLATLVGVGLLGATRRRRATV